MHYNLEWILDKGIIDAGLLGRELRVNILKLHSILVQCLLDALERLLLEGVEKCVP